GPVPMEWAGKAAPGRSHLWWCTVSASATRRRMPLSDAGAQRRVSCRMLQDTTRRVLLLGAAGALAEAIAPAALAGMAPSKAAEAGPPIENREDFIRWMQAHRGEEPAFLARRWERFLALRANGDIADDDNARAFLTTPRERFVLERDAGRAYDA